MKKTFFYTLLAGLFIAGSASASWYVINPERGEIQPLTPQEIGARTEDSGFSKKDVSGTLTSQLDDSIEVVDLQGASLTNTTFTTLTATTSTADVFIGGIGEFTPNVDIEGSADTYGTNLLSNGTFEQWDDANNPTDWDVYDAGGSAVVAQESTEVYAGTYSAKLTMDGAVPIPAVIQQQETSLTAGDTYRARAYAKTDDSCDFYFNVLNGPFDTATQIYKFASSSWETFTGTENQDTDYQSNFTVTASFAQYTSESFTVPANGNINLTIVSDGAVSTSVYVDNATLGTYTVGTDAQLNFVSGTTTYSQVSANTIGELLINLNEGSALDSTLSIQYDTSSGNTIKLVNDTIGENIWISGANNQGGTSGNLYLTGGSRGSGTSGRTIIGRSPDGSTYGGSLGVGKDDSIGEGIIYELETYSVRDVGGGAGTGVFRAGSEQYQAESIFTIGFDSEVAVGYKSNTSENIFSVKHPYYYDYVKRENNVGAFSDYTDDAKDSESSSFSILESDSDYFYVGQSTQSSEQIYISITTPGGNVTPALEYWNGSAWTNLAIDSDGTSNLTQSGAIEFTTPNDWEANTVDSDEAFWLRLSSATAPSPFPTALNVNHSLLQPLSIYAMNDDANPKIQMTQAGVIGLGNYASSDLGSVSVSIKGLSPVSQTSALLVENASGTDLLEIKDDGTMYALGKVGIATTTPAFDLDVYGDARIKSDASLKIPYASDPTVDASGEIAIETASSSIHYHDGTAERKISDILTSCATIFEPTSTIDLVGVYTPYDNITVVEETCLSSTSTLVFNITDGTNDMDSITCSTTLAIDNSLSNNTFTRGETLKGEFGAAGGTFGTDDSITYCFSYRLNP